MLPLFNLGVSWGSCPRVRRPGPAVHWRGGEITEEIRAGAAAKRFRGMMEIFLPAEQAARRALGREFQRPGGGIGTGEIPAAGRRDGHGMEFQEGAGRKVLPAGDRQLWPLGSPQTSGNLSV